MAKPGQMKNVANPEVSAMRGMMDAAEVGRGSHQDAATTQTASMNPNRLIPPQMPSRYPGDAEVNPNNTMDGINSDYSASLRNVDKMRRKIFG